MRLLRQLLATVDTQLEFEGEAGGQEGAAPVQSPPRQQPRKQVKEDRRRVSFDDARYEEHWLSEHSETIERHAPEPQGLLRLPPLRGGPNGAAQRARSISSERIAHRPTQQQYQQEISLVYNASDPDGPADSSLYKSDLTAKREHKAQLNEMLEVFRFTTMIRTERRYIHVWHDAAIAQRERNRQSWAIATAYDARRLCESTIDEWRNAASERRQARLFHAQQEAYFERLERRAGEFRGLYLVEKCFTHWHARHLALRHKTMRASQLLLAMRYFKRWREITLENAAKTRIILTRKTLAMWRNRTARRLLVHEQATAHHEHVIQRRTYWQWFWLFCSRKVEVGYRERIERKCLRTMAQKVHDVNAMKQQANATRSGRLFLSSMRHLRQRLASRQEAQATAQAHRELRTKKTTLKTLQLQARLAPLEKTMTLRVTLTLQRKAFSVWHLHLDLTRQAADVDRRRVLHDAWTNWNDALRCRALAQRIDERLLVENLYRWVLQERLSLFARARDARLKKQCLLALRSTTDDLETRLQQREAIFIRNRDRRQMAFGMLRMNIALREREDAERAAVEFANGRVLPKVLQTLVEQSDHARQLARWAADARFYCLCTSTLKTWKERTVEHKHQRRRNAYVTVRARIKLRLVSNCFVQWRTKCMEVHSMNGEGERRAHARSLSTATQAFDTWRRTIQTRNAQDQQAITIDTQRLLSSALAALQLRNATLIDLNRTAETFHHDTELALQSSALKKLQWATFTASQQTKTADALAARNRDQHVKQMLRHWFAQSSARRAARFQPEPAEPESPSLRPASRAASRTRSAERFRSPARTPGYAQQTPSRARRSASRFRPIPTPAPYTPLAFDQAYLTTTPAPLGTIRDASPVGLTPQVTPFERKLRAGGFGSVPPSALRSSVLGRSVGGGTAKSVRFASAGRFGRSGLGFGQSRVREVGDEGEGEGREGHLKSS